MRRREFLALSAAVLAFPMSAGRAQQAGLRRIVFLSTAVTDEANWQAIVQGLADHGYVDGKTVRLERDIAPNIDAAAEYAARVVASKPDVILCITTPAALAAKNATTTVPIVMSVNDPVGAGLVASLARPGGNVTGNALTAPDFVGKQLSVLRELLPKLRRLAVLALPADQSHAPIVAQMRSPAEAAKVELVVLEFDERLDFDAQLERVARADVQAFLVLNSQYFAAKNEVSASFQVRTGIVRMSGNPSFEPFLGLISYGSNNVVLRRQLGEYVDAILKGAKPADLPVQQPTVFDLAINLKTAKAMGLAIPPSLLAQATIVVE